MEQSLYSALRRRFVKFEQWGKGVARVCANVAIERSAVYASSGGDTPFGFEAIVVSMDMLRLFEEDYAKTPPPGSAMLTSVFAA